MQKFWCPKCNNYSIDTNTLEYIVDGGIVTCDYCGTAFTINLSAQSVQPTAGTCPHLSAEFDYTCMRCGELVSSSRR